MEKLNMQTTDVVDIRIEQELKEILEHLQNKGWEPLLCDSPIPFYDSEVMCGNPPMTGDVVMETKLIPKELLGMQPEFLITVQGDSMKDVDIQSGDTVKILMTQNIHDGDIVLARIDDEFTLKSYCEDENGESWLIPQNEAYSAFSLSDKLNVSILGIVKEIIKGAPRISYRDCMKLIKKAKAKQVVHKEISQLQISRAIRKIAPLVEIARHWYAVYRVMADLNIVGEDDFDTFIDMIKTEVSGHQSLPTRTELQRMAVQSFAKPVILWNSSNAPVQGKRYHDYLKIAKTMEELLTT